MPAAKPKRTPRLRLNVSTASTIRASISTWRTGMSMRWIRRRTSSRRAGVSWTNSLFVRASTTTLPRFDSMRCLSSARSSANVFGLLVVERRRSRCAAARDRRSAAATRGRASPWSRVRRAAQSAGHCRSCACPGPCDCRMMSSAWSHGTSFRRRVIVAADRVAGDDVQVGEVGDHLQQRADVDVLEVERQPLALVALARILEQRVRIFLDRLHFDDEAGVALVGVVFPRALAAR